MALATPIVLLYHLEEKRQAAVKGLCLSLKIRARVVPPEAYGQPLAVTAGLEKATEEVPPAEAIPEEMLVMVNFSQELLNRFLQGFHRMHIPPVSLKAILTPANLHWNAAALYQELTAERKAIEEQTHE